jgi:plasmid stability protein
LPEFLPGVKDLSPGSRHSPSGAKYNENRVFSPQHGHNDGCRRLLYQRFTTRNSLLGGSIEYQSNFCAEQRIQTAHQSKNNGISAGRENRRIWSPEEHMSAIVIRNVSPETHRALQVRAARHGRSAEGEARMTLDDAILPKERMKLGSALAAFGKSVGGLDLDISRRPNPGDAD